MAPVSLEELTQQSSSIAAVNITQASLSANHYTIMHSGEKKFYLHYVATVIESVKSGEIRETIEFSSREPLLINREYVVFLEASKTDELLVAQAGFAAFEKSYISFKSGINEALRIPSSYITLPKNLSTSPDVTKRNEQSSYVWVEWLPFKNWQIQQLELN